MFLRSSRADNFLETLCLRRFSRVKEIFLIRNWRIIPSIFWRNNDDASKNERSNIDTKRVLCAALNARETEPCLSILAYNSFQERNRGDSSYREEFYGIKNVTQTGEKKALASKNPCIISRFEKFKQGTWNRPNYVLRRSPSCSRDVE